MTTHFHRKFSVRRHPRGLRKLVIMGALCSRSAMEVIMTNSPKFIESAIRSRMIDEDLTAESIAKKDLKLLLLGPAESGKSTIFKQMKIIHSEGFGPEERLLYRPVVYRNAVQSLTTIIHAMKHLRIKYGDSVLLVNQFLNMTKDLPEDELPGPVAEVMIKLWADERVQRCIRRYREFQLSDCAQYFLDSLERIKDPDYVPTVQDVLHTRVQTRGLAEMKFSYKNVFFRVLDVGGERSERRKWIHYFENVKAVLFVVATSDFDLKSEDFPHMGRMRDTFKLFSDICHNRWLETSSMILFLNKIDIFERKLKLRRRTMYEMFEDYTLPHTLGPALDFLKGKFESLNHSDDREVYTHNTWATNTENVRFVFDAVGDTIIKEDLKACGMW